MQVFTSKLACCNKLNNAGVQKQGICAVPDDQWSCFVPDASQRYAPGRTLHGGVHHALTQQLLGHPPLTICDYL